jgi:hypothetical protein
LGGHEDGGATVHLVADAGLRETKDGSALEGME